MDISLWEFIALAAATLLVGFSKTAVSGANTVSLAVFAAVLPARESTGVLLPLLIVGDTLAVLNYRRHAHWPTLLRLFPAVAAGVVVGTLFLVWADDEIVRTSIGAILLLMAGVTMWRRRASAREADAAPPERSHDASETHAAESGAGDPGSEGPVRPPAVTSRAGARDGRRAKASSYGVLGGFTTMVANAGGPVMSLYLISAGFRKLEFLGTAAWFFLIVNTTKVPFSAGLGLIDGHSLLVDATLVVFVFPGAYIGRVCADRINQLLFERLVIGATVLGGVELLVH